MIIKDLFTKNIDLEFSKLQHILDLINDVEENKEIKVMNARPYCYTIKFSSVVGNRIDPFYHSFKCQARELSKKLVEKYVQCKNLTKTLMYLSCFVDEIEQDSSSTAKLKRYHPTFIKYIRENILTLDIGNVEAR